MVEEERMKCAGEDRRVNREVEDNEALKCRREALEKSASRVMKQRDSD